MLRYLAQATMVGEWEVSPSFGLEVPVFWGSTQPSILPSIPETQNYLLIIKCNQLLFGQYFSFICKISSEISMT